MHKMPKIKRNVELREKWWWLQEVLLNVFNLSMSQLTNHSKKNQKKVQWLLYKKYRYNVLLKQLID